MFKTEFKTKFSKQFLIIAMVFICCIGLIPMRVMADGDPGKSNPIIDECNCTDNCGWTAIANEQCPICSEDYTQCKAVVPECSCEGYEKCSPSYRKSDCDFCAYQVSGCLGSSEYTLTLQYPDHNEVITQKNDNVFEIPREVPVFNGYTFLYWTDIKREGSIFTPGSYYCIDGKEATLKTQFGVIVNFKTGADEDVEINNMPGTIQSAGTQQQTISLDEYCPTRVGYKFLGWSDGTNIITEVQLGGDYPDSATVTAMWELNSIEDDTDKVDDNNKTDDTNKVDDNNKTDDTNKVDDNNKTDDINKVDDNNKTDDTNKVDDNNKTDNTNKVTDLKLEGTSSTQGKTPKTGDYSNTTMWVILMIVGLAGIGTTLFYKKIHKLNHSMAK